MIDFCTRYTVCIVARSDDTLCQRTTFGNKTNLKKSHVTYITMTDMAERTAKVVFNVFYTYSDYLHFDYLSDCDINYSRRVIAY